MINNIKEIKDSVNIVDVIKNYVKLSKKGANSVGRCPFHNEKTPSFVVSKTKEMYKCFGCGESGDVISFLKKHEKISFKEAVKLTAKYGNIDFEETEKKYTTPKHRLEKIDTRFIEHFESRGISNDTLLRFNVTQSKERMPKAETEIDVVCFNYMRGGELVNIKFRGANKDFKLNPNSELILYNLDAIIGDKTAVICEGEIDCLSLHEAGIYNAVSVPNGASVKGDNKLEYIYNCMDYLYDKEKIIIFTDNDVAGQKLKKELTEILGPYRCYFIDYPKDCKDANHILTTHGKEFLKQLVDNAKISEGLEWLNPLTATFPIEVFPDVFRNSILEVCQARSLALEFVSTAALWTVSSLAGTHYHSDFNGEGKNILFCLFVAPMSVGKTPAYKVVCDTPLAKILNNAERNHKAKVAAWEEERAEALQKKSKFTKKRPLRYIPFASDGTTEGYIQLSIDQPNGIGVYHDEAESIINAGAFKKNNDSISFFTQAFSGGRVMQIRADRESERVVPNLNMNLLMGTQTSRLSNIFTQDRLESGFASRFLMVESDYIELNTNVDPFSKNKEMCFEWVQLVEGLYNTGEAFNNGEIEAIKIHMPDSAKDVYREYYRNGLIDANKRIENRAESYIIGTEAKMSAYFPRLCQILAIIHDSYAPVISEKIVHLAHKLYRYYSESTVRILSKIVVEVNTGLPPELELLYQSLPDTFNRKDAVNMCIKFGLNESKFESAMRRNDFKKLFTKVEKGIYKKN